MEPLTVPALRGVWATVLLPLREVESIDVDVLAAALNHVLASGLHGGDPRTARGGGGGGPGPVLTPDHLVALPRCTSCSLW